RFWFGDGGRSPGLAHLREQALEDADPAAVNTVALINVEGTTVEVRNGKYGPFVRRGEDTASLPDDLAMDELTVERIIELLSAPKGDEPIGQDPTTGLPVYAKNGRYGPYVQLGDVDTLPEKQKPRMSSLFADMDLATITVDQALEVLSLPRVLGEHPDGGEVVAKNGRYGPYVEWREETRSIESERQLLTIGLDEALAALAQPKTYGAKRSAAATAPLRELGADDPVSGKPMVIKDGRFGPYVTDGETNASLRKGDTVEALTVERASELLEIRRANPSTKKPKKAAAKKNAAAQKKTAPKKKKKAAAKKKT
ncbi:MAG: DNA topoisomerase I, partial [Acidimicrobiia bacterium]|nr:DNA topoisomerase I [Acidimicrobiia bacterium]